MKQRKSKYHGRGGAMDNPIAACVADVVELFRTRYRLSLDEAAEATHLMAQAAAQKLEEDSRARTLAYFEEQTATLPPDEREAELASVRKDLTEHRCSELRRVSPSRAKKLAVHAAKRRRDSH